MSESNTGKFVQATKFLDVRPILAEGGEPFVTIMEAAVPLETGETLLLVAPFEPVPLYQALGARGFMHKTQKISEAEWRVLFTRV